VLAGSTSLANLASFGGAGSSCAAPRVLRALEVEPDDGSWTLPEGVRKYDGVLKISDGDAGNGWSATALDYSNHWTSTNQLPLDLITSGQLGRYSAFDPTDGGNSTRAVLSGEWHRHDASGYTNVSAFARHYKLKL
jgi:hypothetical protein